VVDSVDMKHEELPEHHRTGHVAAPQLPRLQAGMEARSARVTGLRGEGITTDYTDYTDEDANPTPTAEFH